MYSPFSLEGKTILITGATSGIGKTAAIKCAQAGANVIATGRNERRLNEIINLIGEKKCLGIAADLTQDSDICSILEKIPEINGLVLCAGINETSPIKFATRKKIDRIFEVNFFSQIELLRLLMKKKKLSSGTSVVAISSIGGNEAFSIGQAAYGASKAALLSWVRYSAKELSSYAIRVNAILPGHIETPMNENIGFTEEQLESYKMTIPLKRFGQPEDIANGIIYLLSDASAWITGTALKIDGGSTL